MFWKDKNIYILLVLQFNVISLQTELSSSTQYFVFVHWMLCYLEGYVEREGPYLSWQAK